VNFIKKVYSVVGGTIISKLSPVAFHDNGMFCEHIHLRFHAIPSRESCTDVCEFGGDDWDRDWDFLLRNGKETSI
jgi:hypothetical protein